MQHHGFHDAICHGSLLLARRDRSTRGPARSFSWPFLRDAACGKRVSAAHSRRKCRDSSGGQRHTPGRYRGMMVEATLQSHSVRVAPLHVGEGGVPHIGVKTRSVPEPDPVSCDSNPPTAVTPIAPALITGAAAPPGVHEEEPDCPAVAGLRFIASEDSPPGSL